MATPSPCLSSGSASSEGLGLCGLRRRVLLVNHVSRCWDGLVSGAFPGCVTRCFSLTSRFLPPRPAKVTIYVTQCRHFLSFLSSFSGVQRILGYLRPRSIVAVHLSRTGKRRSICGLHLEENWDDLRVAFKCWCEGCRPELRHSARLSSVTPADAVENKMRPWYEKYCTNVCLRCAGKNLFFTFFSAILAA